MVRLISMIFHASPDMRAPVCLADQTVEAARRFLSCLRPAVRFATLFSAALQRGPTLSGKAFCKRTNALQRIREPFVINRQRDTHMACGG